MQRLLNSQSVLSSWAIAVGVTSPLTLTNIGWAQTLEPSTQPNQVLYYGWQAQDRPLVPGFLDAASVETALEHSEFERMNGTQVEAASSFGVENDLADDSADDSVDDPNHDSSNHAGSDSTDDSSANIHSIAPSAALLIPNSTTFNQSPSTLISPLNAEGSASDLMHLTHPADAITQNLPEGANSPEFETGNPADTEAENIEAESAAPTLDGIAPSDMGQTIADIEVRFLDGNGEIEEGHTRSSVYLREFDLEPGTPYDQVAAQRGLDRISRMRIVRLADVVLEPAADPSQVTMVVLVRERRTPILIDLASVSLVPSALEGPFQQNPVLGRGSNQTTGLSAVGSVQFLNLGGNDQSLTVQLEGGETVFNTELSFVDPWIGNDPTGIAFNLFNQRSIQRVFAEGNRDVDLPNKNTPWVHRFGGGIQVFRPVAEDWDLALGVNYQQISIHNSAFETERFERDELGERLIVSDDDFDDLLTIQFSGEFNQIEYLENAILPAPLFDLPPEPIEGPRFRFGIDQAIPIGDASIDFTRFSANYVHYLPLDLFGFTEGPRTLVLNAQTGVMFGDIPPYEAFGIDAGPLDSYASSGLASGSRFAIAVAEYRFPIANFRLIRRDVELIGALFSGFASTLGSGDEVIGDPSVSRQKPEDGFVSGVGLRARTAFGLFRVEASINNDGNAQLVITGGGKF